MFVTLGILLIPLIAMQFTSEVNWTLSDFVIAAALLAGTGLVLELIMKNAHGSNTKIILAAVLIAILMLAWAELAVGVFGTPFAGS